jgi:hypothetical protein
MPALLPERVTAKFYLCRMTYDNTLYRAIVV